MYFVELFSGPKLLGVYTLFFGICNSVSIFVDAAVFSFSYPKLVSLYKSGQHAAFKSAKRDFGRQTLIAIAVLAPAAGLLIGPVLELIDKPLYLQHLPVFFLLLATNTFKVIGQIPHYALYAMGYDRSIVGANIAGFIAFIVLSVLLGPKYGICGVVTALLMAVAVVGALKQWKIISLGRRGMTAVNKL
jgi:O-antigen/teichoic acid export membrane protein